MRLAAIPPALACRKPACQPAWLAQRLEHALDSPPDGV